MRKLMKHPHIFILSLLATGASMIFSACSNEVTEEEFNTETIVFKGKIQGIGGTPTRDGLGLGSSTSGSFDITADFYGNLNFYIDKVVDGNNEIVTYQIPSGQSGTLSALNSAEALQWSGRTAQHTFYGWTYPMEGVDFQTNGTKAITFTFEDTYVQEATNIWNNSTNNTPAWPANCWKNGEILEKFVGTVQGPISYASNGMYVPLEFRHLVSKIFLNSFRLVDNENAVSYEGVVGNITFYGLPKKATFYPKPEDANGKPVAPYVDMSSIVPETGITYAIKNQTEHYEWEGSVPSSSTANGIYAKDCWYIPPEIDLTTLSFKIEIYEKVSGTWQLSSKFGQSGAFYGDFSNIKLDRQSYNSGYNSPDGGDDTVLHAGEYLVLSMDLSANGSPALKGQIIEWTDNSNTDRTAYQHVKQGIYTLTEAKKISDIMDKIRSNPNNESYQQQLAELWDLYGSGETTADDPEGEYPEYNPEKKIFRLYDDLGNGSTVANDEVGRMKNFYMGDDYILDGMGHTIMFANPIYPYLGPMRDVYLRNADPSRDYIVYIDKDGWIYTVNPVTYVHTPTGNNVNTAKNPYRINLSTGQFQ